MHKIYFSFGNLPFSKCQDRFVGALRIVAFGSSDIINEGNTKNTMLYDFGLIFNLLRKSYIHLLL